MLKNFYGVCISIGDGEEILHEVKRLRAQHANPAPAAAVLTNLIQVRAIANLAYMVEQSLDDILAEYEMMNAGRPADGQPGQSDWDNGLHGEASAVFDPYLEHLSSKWLADVFEKHRLFGPGGAESAAARFGLELWSNGPGADMPAVLAELGITEGDVKALEDENPTVEPKKRGRPRKPKAEDAVAVAGHQALQAMVAAYQPWAESFDALAVFEALRVVLACPPGTDWLAPGVVDALQALAATAPADEEPAAWLLDQFNRTPWPQGGSVNAKDAAPGDGVQDEPAAALKPSHEEVALAPARASVPAAAPTGPGTNKRQHSKSTQEDRAHLVAAMMAANVNEHEIAAAIGVSRATVNNYHHGKARWTPDAPCCERVAQLLVTKMNGWDAVLEKLGYQPFKPYGKAKPYQGPDHGE